MTHENKPQESLSLFMKNILGLNMKLTYLTTVDFLFQDTI